MDYRFSVIAAFVLKFLVLVAAQVQVRTVNPLSTVPAIRENMCVGRMDGIIFPDPDHCDAYVQCQRGAVRRQRCESGTLFDLKLYYCVPSHSTNCGTRRQPISAVEPENSPSSEEHHRVSDANTTEDKTVYNVAFQRFVVV